MTEQTLQPKSKRDESAVEGAFLLAVHLMCIDQQIHHEEDRFLEEFAEQLSLPPSVLEKAERIVGQHEPFVTPDECAAAIAPRYQEDMITTLVALSLADGYACEPERIFIDKIAKDWGIPEAFVESEYNAAQLAPAEEESSEDVNLSLGARVLAGLRSALGSELIKQVKLVLPGRLSASLTHLEREILLAGPDYSEAIAKCERVAASDLEQCEPCLLRQQDVLRELQIFLETQQLKHPGIEGGQQAKRKEAEGQIRATVMELENRISVELADMKDSLLRLRRAAKFFTIAFMGKSKSGKSTLHSTVVGEGWNSIGAGKQRTTRFNRVYEWKKIRIVDTPGIAAPGGEVDEAIARSALIEADIVCLILTNDRQAKSEFTFLKHLKLRGKPLVILLNVQKNLRREKYLRDFLADPDAPFSDEPEVLGGHKARIKRDAEAFYQSKFFDIYPVQLLAARMAKDGTQEAKRAETLFRASRLGEFMDSFRVAIIEHGAIRRSQTILGASSAAMYSTAEWLGEQAKDYHDHHDRLQQLRDKFDRESKKLQSTLKKELDAQLAAHYGAILDKVRDFAERNCEKKEKALNEAWKRYAKRLRLQDGVQDILDGLSSDYSLAVQDMLDEIGKEFRIAGSLKSSSARLRQQSLTPRARKTTRYGGAALVVLGAIAFIPGLNIAAGVAWGLTITGTLIGLATGFFKSKAQKRAEATGKISRKLRGFVKKLWRQTSEQASTALAEHIGKSREQVMEYLDRIVSRLAESHKAMAAAYSEVDDGIEQLNRLYAVRVVDWVEKQPPRESAEGGLDMIRSVARTPGTAMNIVTTRPVKSARQPDEVQSILQEDISFSTNKKPGKG